MIGGDHPGLGIVRSLGQRGIPVCVVDDQLSVSFFSRYRSDWEALGALPGKARNRLASTRPTRLVHNVHMKEISVRDLHLKTGDWVRKVRIERRIVISERGVPVATLIPFEPPHKATPLAKRRLVQGFGKLPTIDHDSTEYIASDRDKA